MSQKRTTHLALFQPSLVRSRRRCGLFQRRLYRIPHQFLQRAQQLSRRLPQFLRLLLIFFSPQQLQHSLLLLLEKPARRPEPLRLLLH
jgi:hypothetical protein